MPRQKNADLKTVAKFTIVELHGQQEEIYNVSNVHKPYGFLDNAWQHPYHMVFKHSVLFLILYPFQCPMYCHHHSQATKHKSTQDSLSSQKPRFLSEGCGFGTLPFMPVGLRPVPTVAAKTNKCRWQGSGGDKHVGKYESILKKMTL